MKRTTLLIAILALLRCVPPAAGQSDRATISGSVMDSSGALIPNAGVVLTNTETGLVTQASANEIGLYTLSNVPFGRYELKITAAGFKAYSRSGITVMVGQSLRLDVTLEPGQVQETVTVTADASLLKVDTAQISTTVQSAAIKDLPLSFNGELARARAADLPAASPAGGIAGRTLRKEGGAI